LSAAPRWTPREGDGLTLPLRPAAAPGRPKPFAGLLISMRPKQWTKNLLVFGPLVFAYKLFAPELLARAVAAFVVFCLASSAVYLVNDRLDLDCDRQHPEKSLRPLAAGQITAGQALLWAGFLGLAGVGLGFAVQRDLGLTAAGYVALMLVYSSALKHMVIIDVFAIAGGFILRAVAGALAIQVHISPWLYVCTLLLSLFLGFSKRYNELLVLDEAAANHRRILDEYTPAMLEQMSGILMASTIMAYSLYTFSAESLPANHSMMLTIPFVLYGIFRYYYLVHRKNLGGAPELVLMRDIPLIVDVALWGLTSIGVLYLGK
jgi:4-hydroxybenzoate polyprenyltransferase